MLVEIEMDRGHWDKVRRQTRTEAWGNANGCMTSEAAMPYTYQPVFFFSLTKPPLIVDPKVKSLKINGVQMENVYIRKKGFFGSASISKPSLKLKFKGVKTDDGEPLDRLTLQNDKQDPMHMRQYLAFNLFRKAGRPACRVSHASVKLNGVQLGIFQNLEPIKQHFLSQTFKKDDGDLWEGALSDFNTKMMGTFQHKQGRILPRLFLAGRVPFFRSYDDFIWQGRGGADLRGRYGRHRRGRDQAVRGGVEGFSGRDRVRWQGLD